MTYDPGKILPNLTCPNCGFVGQLKIVGSNATASEAVEGSAGLTCNQCSFVKLYAGRQPGFPKWPSDGLKVIADPTSDFPVTTNQ